MTASGHAVRQHAGLVQNIAEGACALCGYAGDFPPFFPGASLRETRCPQCGASRRNRDLARVLLAECRAGDTLASSLDTLRPLRIYELQAAGALHRQLRSLPGYVCSEYLRGVPPGERNAAGVLCQDAACLLFPEASFDVVISQDVLEHMEDPWRGFAEIHRVLKPGGRHLFTVPLHEGYPTRARTRRNDEGRLEELLPLIRHKDPLDTEGAPVFWDYGDDLTEILGRMGITARIALHAAFYSPDQLCSVLDRAAHARYLRETAQGRHAGFFLYNSIVFVAEKDEQPRP